VHTISRTLAAAILALGMTGITVDFASAQGPGNPGQGPGYGAGYGGGPGMMGGYGWGPGMGGYGGGPGAGWGARGGGPGGGYGPRGGGGPGFGGGPLAALNLTEEQSQKIAVLQEENRRRNWEVMGQVRSEQFKLRQVLSSETPDPNAVAAQQQKVDELRRQMLKSRVESRNQVAAILTPEQRQQFRSYGPWWLED
jgi:Spy/CpxP family protein refolding chaperone